MSAVVVPDQPTDDDVAVFCADVQEHYGYDFRQYHQEPIKRRLDNLLKKTGCEDVRSLLEAMRADATLFGHILSELTVTTTAMFRDPEVFATLVREVFPYLRTYSRLKIWHAGCATGEEAYSLAILLHEHDLLRRTRIYATDINPQALAVAKEGIYPLKKLKGYSQSYSLAGGGRSLSDYFEIDYGLAKVSDEIASRILFSKHDLVTDSVFGEMQLIVCRNVLIYFNPDLQPRVMRLFRASLCAGGFICLGPSEALSIGNKERAFRPHARPAMIYRAADSP